MLFKCGTSEHNSAGLQFNYCDFFRIKQGLHEGSEAPTFDEWTIQSDLLNHVMISHKMLYDQSDLYKTIKPFNNHNF